MSQPTEPPAPPAGWYPDPWQPGAQRWWDGQGWTGNVSSRPDLPIAQAPGIPPSRFWADARLAAAASFSTPGLLIATVAVEVVPATLNAAARADSFATLGVLGFLLEIATIGFYGTQRVWLLTTYRGQALSTAEAYRLTKSYFGRFFGLGVRASLVFLPVFLVVVVISVATKNSAAILAGVAVAGFVLDIVLTFVVPDLTFYAASPKHAWESGRALLRSSWPQSRWYVLTPGIALLSLSNALGGIDRNIWAAALESAVFGLLALIFRGTILAYYLRLRPEIRDHQPGR